MTSVRKAVREFTTIIATEREIKNLRMEHCETAGIRVQYSYMQFGDLRTSQEPPPPGVAFAIIVSDLVKMVLFLITNFERLPDNKVVRPLIRDIVLGGEDGSGKFFIRRLFSRRCISLKVGVSFGLRLRCQGLRGNISCARETT